MRVSSTPSLKFLVSNYFVNRHGCNWTPLTRLSKSVGPTAYKTWLNKRVYHLLNKTVFLNLSFDPFKQIFSKILRSFGLPVGPNKYHVTYADPSYEFSSTCLWVVAMISPTGAAMSHIRQFIQTIEPFLHPSNMGWWQRSLNGAISQLCSMFTARVHLERLVQWGLSLSNVYLQW